MSDQTDYPPATSSEKEALGTLDLQWVERIRLHLEAQDKSALITQIVDLHPADAADALEQLSNEGFEAAIALIKDDIPPEIIAKLRDEYRQMALPLLPDTTLAYIVQSLDTDDAVPFLEDLDDARQSDILSGLAASERTGLESALAFDEDTAGRLMQREFVAAPEFWTVGQTVDHARGTADDLPDTFFEIYIVDPAFRPLGAVSLATILRTPRQIKLAEIMRPLEAYAQPDMDQEAVAYLFQKYSLVSIPVLDEARRLTGMITVDDMVEVIQEENKEDLLALSGVTQAGGVDTILDSVRARAPWLATNLFIAFIVSYVIAQFGESIEKLVALAILMPVVAALGGNAGSQALAVIVRAMAERELSGAQAARAVRRETLTALANGLIFAISASLISLAWYQDIILAMVMFTAMLATIFWAGLSGVIVPLTLRRLGADPAVASSVFVLASTDIVGFLSFLGLASWVIA